jgi:hypothetical protein
VKQIDRVLRQSRRAAGVCQADFLAPDVVDGAAPIYRVGARIFDLEQRGYKFEHLAPRHGCTVHRLVSEPERLGGAGAADAHSFPARGAGQQCEPESARTPRLAGPIIPGASETASTGMLVQMPSKPRCAIYDEDYDYGEAA